MGVCSSPLQIVKEPPCLLSETQGSGVDEHPPEIIMPVVFPRKSHTVQHRLLLFRVGILTGRHPICPGGVHHDSDAVGYSVVDINSISLSLAHYTKRNS